MQLKRALQRKAKLHWNPFAFFTSSLPQVIMHAYYKRRKESTNVWITCLDTTTITTLDGAGVKFLLVTKVTEIMELSIPDRHTFEDLDFEDVWMTSDSIVPGGGSSICRFGDLVGMDLFTGVPELGVIQCHRPGVASPIRNLREYWFEEDVDLTNAELNFAAQFASTFEPIWPDEDRECLQMHIFAWFLTTKEQIPDGSRLVAWLAENGASLLAESSTATDPTETKLRELQRFYEINDVLSWWSIEVEDIRYLDSSIPEEKVERRRKDYKSKRKEIKKIRDQKRADWLGRVAAEKAKKTKLPVLLTWFARERESMESESGPESEDDNEEEDDDVSMADSEDSGSDQSDAEGSESDESQTEDTEMSPPRPSELDQRIKDMHYVRELDEDSDDVILNDVCEDDELDIDEGIEDM